MGKKLTQEQFLDKLQEVHGGKITTSAIYVNNSSKVAFRCEICGNTWTATPNSVMCGHGCPDCAGTRKSTQEEFLNKLFKVHGTNITTTDTYTGNKDKLMFHCTTCNYFWKTTPNDMLCGYGCPRCGGNLRKTHKQFLLDLKKVHGDSITAVGEYTNAVTKIEFHCNICNNNWKAKPNGALLGYGCPNCASSSGEQTTRAILEFNKIDYDPQHNFKIKGKTHRLDFVLKDANNNWCVIQPDGIQHTWSTKQFEKSKNDSERAFYERVSKDRDENKYLPALGVRVLRIPWIWFDLNNTFTLLQDFLGYKLEKPDKDYIPMYKDTKVMVYDYLKHGNANIVAKKYHISSCVLFKKFKNYFGMPRSEYVKLHPEYKIARKVINQTRVVAIGLDGTRHTYPSQAEASRQIGITASCINCCLHGTQKTAGGYRWEELTVTSYL